MSTTKAVLTSRAFATVEEFFGRRLPWLGRSQKDGYTVTIAGSHLTVRKGEEAFAGARIARGWRVLSWMTLIKDKKTCTDEEAARVLKEWMKPENPLIGDPK